MCLLSRTLVFVFAIATSALAQEAIVAGNSNGIPYAIGGVGLDSREALLAKEGEYNLMVIFSLEDGHYLGGAAVTVRDHAGKTILNLDAKGPWLFVRLPPGSYTVEAQARNTIRKKPILIGNKMGLKRIHLTWR
jgi:hypothetical protein